jgi:hypothetical protein
MKQSFEIKIPSNSVQASWDSLNERVSEAIQKKRTEMDEFIDNEQAEMSAIMKKFAGKKVRFTVEIIKE